MAYSERVKALAQQIDPECWVSYSGKTKPHKRMMDARRTKALETAQAQTDEVDRRVMQILEENKGKGPFEPAGSGAPDHGPHCDTHASFQYDCIDCADAGKGLRARPYEDPILNERQGTYGDFEVGAEVIQQLKFLLKDASNKHGRPVTADQCEALDQICTKLGRIVTGDPNHPDNWDDIAGYAKLVSTRLKTQPKAKA